jgi:hypothetical protein
MRDASMRIEANQKTGDSFYNSVRNRDARTMQSAEFSSFLGQALFSKSALADRNVELARARNDILSLARTDPHAASKFAHDYTYNSLGSPLLDLSDRPNIRYSLTGELVTSKTQAYFQQISQAIQRQCDTLYRQEISKGTPAVEILEKIFSIHDSMPLRFREMLNI